MTSYFNIKDAPYSAIGDYITDDTVSVQAAITAAQAVGGKVLAPYGRYRTSAPLVANDHLIIEGDGYPDDGGAGYGGAVVFNNALKGTVFYPGAHDAFRVTSNNAVQFEKFQIAYNQTAPSGSNLAGIRVNPASGINVRSVFRDINIVCADNAMMLNNALEFKVDNVNMLYGFQNSICIGNPAYPNWGDSSIQNCTMWGNGLYLTSHIAISSHGGLRIIDNKLNGGNPTTSTGILVSPTSSAIQNVEPLIIVGNSLEGQAVGICFANGHPTTASISELVITGNQIWSGTNAILCNTSGTPKWLNGFTICGNVMMSLNGSSQPIVLLDNATLGIISGNQFAFSGSPGGTAIILGALTGNINVQSNVYGANVITKVNNAGGAANTVGGGTP